MIVPLASELDLYLISSSLAECRESGAPGTMRIFLVWLELMSPIDLESKSRPSTTNAAIGKLIEISVFTCSCGDRGLGSHFFSYQANILQSRSSKPNYSDGLVLVATGPNNLFARYSRQGMYSLKYLAPNHFIIVLTRQVAAPVNCGNVSGEGGRRISSKYISRIAEQARILGWSGVVEIKAGCMRE